MWVGMENIIANFHCNQMSTKNVIVCHQTTEEHLWKISLQTSLVREKLSHWRLYTSIRTLCI